MMRKDKIKKTKTAFPLNDIKKPPFTKGGFFNIANLNYCGSNTWLIL